MGLSVALERKSFLSTHQPQRYSVLRHASEVLSRRNTDQAVCELMNEALARVILLAYEEDQGGLCNIDRVTGRFLIPMPWGRGGQTKWGLRRREADILRNILFRWHYPGPSLILYDRPRRSWQVNLYDFETAADAKGWLAKHQVTIALYRDARAEVVQ